jgi:hypothetical protein
MRLRPLPAGGTDAPHPRAGRRPSPLIMPQCGRISKTAPYDRRPGTARLLLAPLIPIDPRMSPGGGRPPVPPQRGAGRSDPAAFGGAGGAGPLGDLAAEDLEMIVRCRGTVAHGGGGTGPPPVTEAAGRIAPEGGGAAYKEARRSRRGGFSGVIFQFSASSPTPSSSARDDNTYIKIRYYP